jgi:hypothetical protein
MDILSYLSLSQFIAEEKLIVSWIGAVISHPIVARVVSIFFCLCTSIDNTELRGSGDKEHGCFICGAFVVRVNEVDKGWHPSQVNNLVVFLEVTWGLFLTRHIGESVYGRY